MNPVITEEHPLILASASRYRAELLARLGLPHRIQASKVDETPLPGELPLNLAQRLAASKAQLVSQQNPGHWVLGSDQVAALDGTAIGKAGTREAAIAQLTAFSNRSVTFYTAIALVCGEHSHAAVDNTVVRFRLLRPMEIERYVDLEPAFDCAGSFKAEGLGIALFSAIEGKDPTGLIGLPLILVRQLLAQAGCLVP
jgi:septum formation protein